MKKLHIWSLGCSIFAVAMLLGVSLGSVSAYVLYQNFWPAQNDFMVQPVSAVVDESNPAILDIPVAPAVPSAPPAQNAPTLGQSRDIVSAVNQTLPAVVTVINQGSRGGGSGTGFFINQDGYVVTNNHVVEGGRNFAVIYARGGTAEATLVGTAPEFDLAVIKVDGSVPATIGWGDSSALPLGEDVIAIGSALGQYQNTVTAGILSGFNRELGGLRGLLQTDAAINHGNSGGPLVNELGEVIGINTMVVRGGRSDAEGLGFAIPSNIAKNVVRNLIETGEANSPFMGIQYLALNPQTATQNGLNVVEGALLQNVVASSPAARAGLQDGDIIMAVNGVSIDDRRPLVSLLLEHLAGETITLSILRDGQTLETNLTLGQRT